MFILVIQPSLLKRENKAISAKSLLPQGKELVATAFYEGSTTVKHFQFSPIHPTMASFRSLELNANVLHPKSSKCWLINSLACAVTMHKLKDFGSLVFLKCSLPFPAMQHSSKPSRSVTRTELFTLVPSFMSHDQEHYTSRLRVMH